MLQESGCLNSRSAPRNIRDHTLQAHPSPPILDDKMANLARTLKSPYLSPHLRPSMSGRTMSSSSDFALASPISPRTEDFGDTVTSGRNTPTRAGGRSGLGRDGYTDGDDAGYRGSRFPSEFLSCSFVGRNSSTSLIGRQCYRIPQPITPPQLVDLVFTWPRVSGSWLRQPGGRAIICPSSSETCGAESPMPHRQQNILQVEMCLSCSRVLERRHKVVRSQKLRPNKHHEWLFRPTFSLPTHTTIEWI